MTTDQLSLGGTNGTPAIARFGRLFLAESSIKVHESCANVVVLVEWENKDFPVADVARAGGLDHDLYDVVDAVVVSGDFDHRFGQQCVLVLDPSIDDRVSFLAAHSLGF